MATTKLDSMSTSQSPIRLTGRQYNSSGANSLHLMAKAAGMDFSNYNHDFLDESMGYAGVQMGRPDDYSSVTNNYSMGMDRVPTGPSLYKQEKFNCKGGSSSQQDCGAACRCAASRNSAASVASQTSGFGSRPQLSSSRSSAYRLNSDRIENRGFEGLHERNSRDHLILPYVASSNLGVNRARVKDSSMGSFHSMRNTVMQE